MSMFFIGETDAYWHNKQVGIVFRIYENKENNGKLQSISHNVSSFS